MPLLAPPDPVSHPKSPSLAPPTLALQKFPLPLLTCPAEVQTSQSTREIVALKILVANPEQKSDDLGNSALIPCLTDD